MNWLFGTSSPRPPTAQALTGVSSDYYAHQNDSNLPVAVAVLIGEPASPLPQATALPPPTAPTYTSSATAEAAARPMTPPPAVNPSYQSYQKVSSNAPISTSFLTAPMAPIPEVASFPPTAVQQAVLAQPISTTSPMQPPSAFHQSLCSDRGPSFVAPPTILPPRPATPLPSDIIHPQQQAMSLPTSYSSLPAMFSRKPMRLSVCPYCRVTNFRTRIQSVPSWKTWLAVLAIVLLFWPLAWIPLVVDCMKTTSHYCPSCQSLLGSVYPFDDCCVKNRR